MKLAIVVPCHKSSLTKKEFFSLSTIKKYLHHYDKYLVSPKKISISLRNFKNIKLNNSEFDSINSYSKLCLKKYFYEIFSKYDYILICQLDVIILNNNIQYWCDKKFSYIGAPTVHKYPINKKPWRLKFFCNGGCSLRNVKDFLNVFNSKKIMLPYNKYTIQALLKPKKIKKFLDLYIQSNKFNNKTEYFLNNFYLNEDVFWTYFAILFNKDFKLPSLTDCLSFAFDGQPEFNFKKNNYSLPFALHGNFDYENLLNKIKE